MWSVIVQFVKKQIMIKRDTEDKQYVYKEPVKMKEILICVGEGLAFILCLVMLWAWAWIGCALIDKCYYYYVPGGGF